MGPNGLLNPCARLLVGLVGKKVSSFFLSFFLAFFLSSFLRTQSGGFTEEFPLWEWEGGGPGLGLGWACGGLLVGLVGFW